ncbi:DEAD/DEAH box helicase [Thauera linaloolentis]|uniref:DEAD-box ATP-dependent RNA helicase RhpA n=1 Tax=Thauera linaloolentis (strain DSM 12138 / JCM 21573 / CCUG 41526 / CIP 105981 / IAM 15112 / NBRC 102519 / 47Lol) TaxID=1123367 RepID=N6Z602_THAL4|nr:DEAD/DEAH box helicase [Thauera linaloolentis]ENO89813.1 putative ATP-dependent RNA helicase [Thauera linaloolentis 47Lol = DSM 12138]MCM8566998.1 DEAD/DEAH box helicase [Thauera linaloolentis]
MSFADLGLIPELLKAVADAGYSEPTPIQRQAIPTVVAGHDVMGGAQTGTGKTAGFTLPLLHRIARHANTSTSPARHQTRALILAPTRELAMQVYESVKTYSKYLPLRSVCIYGGVDIRPQQMELRRGIEVVIATPGRLLDHVEQKSINLSQVEVLVLDEADRMLDMGFIPDIKRILALLPANRQSLLFSATFSDEIKKLADQMLKNPQLIEVARRNMVSETITHVVHPVSSGMKRNLLAHLLRHQPDTQALVFVDTKIVCGRLAHFLERSGISADAIHGDKSQQQRTETLEAFKGGKLRVLVATDVAARGIDIDELPYVINFELPHTAEDYVHRIGRTGRAGHKGNAVSLVSTEEKHWLAEIQKLIKLEIPQEIIPGFDPEPEFSEAGSRSRGRRAAPVADAARAPRSSAAPRQSSGAAPRSGARQRPTVASDGFDFSKPYQPASPTMAVSDDARPAAADARPDALRRSQRPIAVLLGGLGRK